MPDNWSDSSFHLSFPRFLPKKLRREDGCIRAKGLRKRARLGTGEDFNTFALMSSITHGRLTISDVTHTALHAWGGYLIQTEEIKYVSSSNVANVQLREGRAQS